MKKCDIERQKYVYGKGEELNEWNLNNMDNKMEANGNDVNVCNVLPLSRDLEC